MAWRLENLENLKKLFLELNFDYSDEPVNKEYWSQDQKYIVQEARIIASKNDYDIYYIKTNSDSLSKRKAISSKIIKEKLGLCLVCSHNPNGNKWIFSSLSKEFSKSFSETRHIPIDIEEDTDVPKTFVDFLEKIQVNNDSTATSIHSQVSNAFDECSLQIHDELTVNVFEAYKSLTEGIIIDKNNNFKLIDESLEKVRSSVFILLYRLIFVLYAESRNVFKTDNPTYYQKFSLEWIKQNWILNSESASKLQEYEVQNRIKSLFHLIEVGSDALELTTKEFSMISYYGRLFDRDIHKELENWKIPNKQILDAISFITRTREKANYFFLDYSALKTRHLGSIYEHLLEFHLTIKNNKIVELPNPEERVTSASYYTPDYIVDHIVKNAIEPAITKIVEVHSDENIQADKILSLKILDPAMGSGHFLIGSVNYLAERLCEIKFGEVREKELKILKREVVRRCIYGIDLNPLAVDLASVALWLETLSDDKPLSFLQAHLKNGNSLIGSKIDQIYGATTTLMEAQKGKAHFKNSVKKFLAFEELEDDTGSDVKAKIHQYGKMHSKGTVYQDLRFILNAIVAQQFGKKISPLGDYKAKIGENSLDFFTFDEGPEIKKLAEKMNCFHWELEFPEIFFNKEGVKKDNPGFDIVVGNPPYLQLSMKNGVSNNEKEYLITKFGSSMGRLNTFGFFTRLGIDLLKDYGKLGFIIPNTILTQDYYEKIREMILNSCKIETIVNFSDLPFKDAVVENIILVLRKISSEKERMENNVAILGVNEKLDFIKQNVISQKIFLESRKKTFGIFLDNDMLLLKEKIETGTSPLSKFFDINQAIALKYDRAKYIGKEKKDETYKMVIDGRNINRYSLAWSGDYLKYDINAIHSCKREDIFISSEKLFFRRVGDRLIAAYDDKKFYALNTLVVMNKKPEIKTNILYFLGVFNSRLMNSYYQTFLKSTKKVFSEIQARQIENIPIKIPNNDAKKNMIKLIEKMISLNEHLSEIEEKKTNNRTKIEEEIIRTDEEIDELVYDIYNITEDEKKTIESNLSN